MNRTLPSSTNITDTKYPYLMIIFLRVCMYFDGLICGNRGNIDTRYVGFRRCVRGTACEIVLSSPLASNRGLPGVRLAAIGQDDKIFAL